MGSCRIHARLCNMLPGVRSESAIGVHGQEQTQGVGIKSSERELNLGSGEHP